MLYYIVLLLFLSTTINGAPRQENSKNRENEPEQPFNAAQKSESAPPITQQESQEIQQQTENQQQDALQIISESQQQPVVPELTYGLAYLEPQFQYPGYNFLQEKQLFPRVQPQIVFYGPGGHGQPILINPGSPPGNFLVPHQPQPGPNVIIRDTPQRPVFVAGYPKPAHIPPIEKDAEEIPTNPARIPPFPTPSARKPEKLETFNEGKEYPTKSAGEADVLAAADRNPQLIPTRPNLKPGHRFFILNGEDLFTNYPLQTNPEVNLKYAQLEQAALPTYLEPRILQQQKDIDVNTVPIQSFLLRNAITGQISNVQDLNGQEKLSQNLVVLNQPTSQQSFFRSSLPLGIAAESENIQPIGEFRFAPPSEPYFSFDGDDVENDAVVIDAKADDDGSSNVDNSTTEATSSTQKSSEPSMAQAAPGAIAVAGPGGVAGAAPRGTALVGKGGLAVSSPQATAVAGPRKNEEEDKNSTKKTK